MVDIYILFSKTEKKLKRKRSLKKYLFQNNATPPLNSSRAEIEQGHENMENSFVLIYNLF
jgi:hypothetical protein